MKRYLIIRHLNLAFFNSRCLTHFFYRFLKLSQLGWNHKSAIDYPSSTQQISFFCSCLPLTVSMWLCQVRLANARPVVCWCTVLTDPRYWQESSPAESQEQNTYTQKKLYNHSLWRVLDIRECEENYKTSMKEVGIKE